MRASLAGEGATTRELSLKPTYRRYSTEGTPAPSLLRHGQIVVMDNLSAHKGDRIRELIESAGCGLVYLPPCSPDLNPIEEAFSKIKGILLGKVEASTREALVEALGLALWSVNKEDARGFFEHCGYGAPVQSL